MGRRLGQEDWGRKTGEFFRLRLGQEDWDSKIGKFLKKIRAGRLENFSERLGQEDWSIGKEEGGRGI